jgi:hypothetical protein
MREVRAEAVLVIVESSLLSLSLPPHPFRAGSTASALGDWDLRDNFA